MTEKNPLDNYALPSGFVLRGRYRIEELLKVGSRTLIYFARDEDYPEDARFVAVKELILLDTDHAVRDTSLRDFQAEAALLETLTHPSIPEVYDFFTENERAYIVLEYIRGIDLGALLERSDRRPLPTAPVRKWAIQLCDVLSFLHGQEPEPVVFCNLQPSHVMIDPSRRAHLVGFGMARTFLTGHRGATLGAEGYAPPEQLSGLVTPKSDLYALGAILHHVLTLRDPSQEPSFSFEERPIQHFNRAVPDDFVAIVNRALADDPVKRYSSAAELKQALVSLAKRG